MRLKEIWRARQRRLRIDNIPTIKYSSSLIIAQDRLINCEKVIEENKEEKQEDDTSKNAVIATEINFEENQQLMLSIKKYFGVLSIYRVINLVIFVCVKKTKNREEEQIKLMETPLIESNNNNAETIGQNEVNDNDEPYMLHNETCHVCLEDFKEGESIRLLRCKHGFHSKCIKFWIVKRGKCPVCIRDVFTDISDEQDSPSFSLYI